MLVHRQHVINAALGLCLLKFLKVNEIKVISKMKNENEITFSLIHILPA
jgi:hypothetical protein